MPPLAVPDTICLVRCWLPLPQVLVHEVQPDQAVVWQSTGQRNMLHGSDSDLWPQATPPKYASTETERERLREPPAQDLVHLDQADHAVILQSIGQFVAPHTCDTEVGPQAVPPFLAWRTTFLERVCTPPPQVTEQSPQAFHVSARMQLSRRAWVLQACSSACGPQAAPNLLAGVITSRVRACLPPSQVLVHVVQLVHWVRAQSTGHTGRPWQRTVSMSGVAHLAPPKRASRVRWRERVLVASPQVLVHALNSDHGETTQSTGQAWMLQKPLISVVTPQLAPPNLAGLIMERERVWRPPPVLPLTSMFMLPPHVTEHAPYEPQADIVQSTGHAAALQLRDSSRLGHTKPPCAARSMTERERTWVPPPQVLVHAVQRDQPPIWQWIGHGVLLQLSTSTF